MSDRDALIAAVLANPDDDLPRLVYADWCDEHGDPDRAAFIRLQVEAARAEPFGPAWRSAGDQAGRLLNRHYQAWTGHLRGLARKGKFVRGFVGHVEVEAAQFPDSAVFDLEPVRSALVLWYTRGRGADGLEAALRSPRVGRLARLDLANVQPSQFEYDALTGSPYLRGLADLSLRSNPVPPRWLADFLAGDALPGLAGLDLSDIPNLGPAIAAGLARADHRRFARLDLSRVAFRSRDLQRVLEARCVREVEELRLSSGVYPNPGPLHHLEMGWVIPWDRLRLLDLTGHGVGPEGVREIVRVPAATGLRWLRLSANGLSPEAVGLLAAAPHLNLYYLDVRGNGLAPGELEALRRRFPDAQVVG
jgi:uncharacterized protein (TIGR02996 family)